MAKRKSAKGQTTIKKHTYKTNDRVTRTRLKTGGELRCSGRVGSSCFTSDTRRVNLVINPVISHEQGKDREVFTTSGIYWWSTIPPITSERAITSHRSWKRSLHININFRRNPYWSHTSSHGELCKSIYIFTCIYESPKYP